MVVSDDGVELMKAGDSDVVEGSDVDGDALDVSGDLGNCDVSFDNVLGENLGTAGVVNEDTVIQCINKNRGLRI